MSQKFTIWAESLILVGISNTIFLVSESVHHLKKFGEAVDIASEFKKISFILYTFFEVTNMLESKVICQFKTRPNK